MDRPSGSTTKNHVIITGYCYFRSHRHSFVLILSNAKNIVAKTPDRFLPSFLPIGTFDLFSRVRGFSLWTVSRSAKRRLQEKTRALKVANQITAEEEVEEFGVKYFQMGKLGEIDFLLENNWCNNWRQFRALLLRSKIWSKKKIKIFFSLCTMNSYWTYSMANVKWAKDFFLKIVW